MPPFEAVDGDGRAWSRDSLAGRPYVLFFYPQDETPGCIAEACAFRDAWDEFREAGVLVLGVSRDDAASHRAFAQNRGLPFPLLCDADGAMHEAFGGVMLGGLPRRISYLVGPEGRVAAAFDSHLRPEAHAAKMLAAARSLHPMA